MIDEARAAGVLRDLAWAVGLITCGDAPTPAPLADVLAVVEAASAGPSDETYRDALLALGASVVVRLVDLCESGTPYAHPAPLMMPDVGGAASGSTRACD